MTSSIGYHSRHGVGSSCEELSSFGARFPTAEDQMRTHPATASKSDRREPLRDDRQPAVDELRSAINEVRRDAVNAPEEYLRDTIVPAGGE
jgi:hypothetical protein